MKKIIVFGFLILGILASAQEMMIPYKVGNQFGLVDEQEQIVVEPKYEEIIWLGGDYFQTTAKIQLNDKLETAPGNFVERKQMISAKGLLYKGKELISAGPYSGFQVFPEMFIQARVVGDPAKISLNQTEFDNLNGKGPVFFLFNSKGENVHSEGFRRLELVDTIGVSNRNSLRSKYALLFIENFQKQFQMCVFDADAGKFKECLFQEVTDFKIVDADVNAKVFYLAYKDKNGTDRKKVVKREKDYFTIEDLVGAVPEKKSSQEKYEERIENKPEVEAENPSKKQVSEKFYDLKEDTLIYQKDGISTKIPLNQKIKPLFIQPYLQKQAEDMLYKKQGKFGFIQNGKIMEADFDSLAYFGTQHYLACKKIEGKLKCGTLDLNRNQVIPMEYDSIFGQMKVFELNPKSGKLELVVEKKPSPVKVQEQRTSYYVKISPNISIYKNGKMGLVKIDNQMVLPLQYDAIGMNNLKTRGSAVHRFMVLKQDGNYGVVMSNFNSDNQEVIVEIIEPIFPDYPAFYFKDYYGKKGFHLFGLMDENGKLENYASEIGRIFMKP